MQKYDIIVVGGCAAGLTAAVQASRLYPRAEIAVVEHLPRIGKKILATGNGRCNLSNIHVPVHPYRSRDFALPALTRYGVEETLAFFRSLGLLTYTDSEGRIYPLSNTAAGVLDALRFAVDTPRITVLCDRDVKEIKKTENGFTVDNTLACRKLILATGGKASPAQGSDGSGYPLVKQLGHSITRLCPALVPINTQHDAIKGLKGIRVHRAALHLTDGSSEVACTTGEILFTDSGLSGIAAMELAAAVGEIKWKNEKAPCRIIIDFLPDHSEETLLTFLKELARNPGARTIDSLLTGLLPKAVGNAVYKCAGLADSADSFNENDMIRLIYAVKHFPLTVTSAKGFENAQVTRGGVNTREVDPQTLESRLCPNLFFAGELLDVDGGCGGFNLQWAWSSGLLAGEVGGTL